MEIAGCLVARGGAIVNGSFFEEREDLREGDHLISRHREQELEKLAASWPAEIMTHQLHPHHLLILERGGGDHLCSACHKQGSASSWYLCGPCDFHLHSACAVSNTVADSWKLRTKVETFAHRHPMKLVKDASEFICSHCNDKGYSHYRYQCINQCDDQMHLICATNPVMLISFLHPDHLLNLEIRHFLKKCGVCHRGGESNARVYTCDACNFFVHKECAHCSQYYVNFPLHPHPLVYQENHDHIKTVCCICGHKCKPWNYTCFECEGFHFHRECIEAYFFAHPVESSA